jgi:hypothetical protein
MIKNEREIKYFFNRIGLNSNLKFKKNINFFHKNSIFMCGYMERKLLIRIHQPLMIANLYLYK